MCLHNLRVYVCETLLALKQWQEGFVMSDDSHPLWHLTSNTNVSQSSSWQNHIWGVQRVKIKKGLALSSIENEVTRKS